METLIKHKKGDNAPPLSVMTITPLRQLSEEGSTTTRTSIIAFIGICAYKRYACKKEDRDHTILCPFLFVFNFGSALWQIPFLVGSLYFTHSD